MIVENNTVKVEYKNIYNETSNPVSLPSFQRGYSWKKEQATQMINEIIELAQADPSIRQEKQLYLLDFIWYDENKKKKYADGQQRLTTFNILIICINEYIAKNKLPIIPLNTFTISYDNIVEQLKYDKFAKQEKRTTAPFADVWKFFTAKLREYGPSYINEIVEVVKNNCYAYFKRTNNADEAFAMFAQINSGGKPLSKDDVIKTTLNNYSRKYDVDISDCNFNNIKHLVVSYYKLFHSDTKGDFSNLAVMSFLNTCIVNDKTTFKEFCKYVKKTKDISKLSIYHVIKLIDKAQLLHILYALTLSDIDVEAKRDYIDRVLLPLCLLCIVYKFKKVNPGGVAASIFDDVMVDIKNKKKAEDIETTILTFIANNPDVAKISFDDFNDNLTGKKNMKTLKALLIMDVIRKNRSGHLNVSAINLEHIYPQKPCNEWMSNGWPANREDQEELIYSIGNCILLCETVNKSIQNAYIKTKRPKYEDIIPKDKILQTTLNEVDFDAFEKDKAKYIETRQRNATQLVKSKMNGGSIMIT